jgi:hypothetical protein
MKLALRTILVLVFGLALSLGLYIAADSMFGQFMGPRGMNGNFITLISTWRALGGSAQPLGSERAAGGAGLGNPFGGPGERAQVPITDGLEPSLALGQTESDLVWLAIPAALGAAIEIVSTAATRRRRRAAA